MTISFFPENPFSFAARGGLKIGESPKKPKNLVIDSVFNSSHHESCPWTLGPSQIGSMECTESESRKISFATRGSENWRNPKKPKNFVIKSVFNLSHLIINLAPVHWDHARLVVWNVQSPKQKIRVRTRLVLPLVGSESWKIPKKHQIFKIIV